MNFIMFPDYPENHKACKQVWLDDNAILSVVRDESRYNGGHYCGYVRLPKRSLVEREYDGILTYAPIHGGITYACEGDDGSMCYGFDCAHSGDDKDPLKNNIHWVAAECHRLLISVNRASKYEERFLLAKDNESRAYVIDEYHRDLQTLGIMFNLYDNFGAMISVLCGNL